MKLTISLFLILLLGVGVASSQNKKKSRQKQPAVVSAVKPSQEKTKDSLAVAKPLITFYELGSVKCIPCKAMQPVMKRPQRLRVE